MLQQVLLDLGNVGRGQVDLVDRHHQRHAGVLGVADRLDGLRHHLVVGRDDQHDDVGHLGAAGPHRGEGLVARRVEEGDGATAGQHDVVGADVLRDAAGLAGHDVLLADVVEQRRLAVIDVAHDRHHRRPRLEVARRLRFDRRRDLGVVLLLLDRLEAELRRDQLDLVEVEPLVDRHHQAELLERERDDLGGRHLHRLGQLADRDELVDADEGLFPLLLLGHPRRDDLAVGRLVGAALPCASDYPASPASS